jgi:hypothetical protein
MNTTIESFGNTAQRLARNPLGIIALFIVLVYGIAGLVFSTAASNLTSEEKLPIIWFLVLFPVIVLGSFLWLVSRHHSKLYAPGDYKDPEGFFRAMTPAEQREKIKRELSDLEVETDAELVHSVSSKSMASDYFITEDLVIRELEEEFGVEVHRHVGFGTTDDSGKSVDLGFDGSFRSKDGKNYVLEVKYSPGRDFGARFESLVYQIRELSANFDRFVRSGDWPPMTYLFALVASEWTQEKMEMVKRQCAEIRLLKASLDIRFFELPKLQEKFGTK